MYTKLFLLTIFALISNLSFGQYKKNMLMLDEDFDILRKESNFVEGFDLKKYDENFYLNFTIKNDTIPGDYLVFKSKKFKELKPVEIIRYANPVTIKNFAIAFYVVDEIDPQYDFYHIIKISKQENFEIFDYTIKNISNVNIEIDKYLTREKTIEKKLLNKVLTDNF